MSEVLEQTTTKRVSNVSMVMLVSVNLFLLFSIFLLISTKDMTVFFMAAALHAGVSMARMISRPYG
jgi:uncharacterized integral membrane protein